MVQIDLTSPGLRRPACERDPMLELAMWPKLRAEPHVDAHTTLPTNGSTRDLAIERLVARVAVERLGARCDDRATRVFQGHRDHRARNRLRRSRALVFGRCPLHRGAPRCAAAGLGIE